MAPHRKHLYRSAPTFEEIERALDAGKLEMMRPWGDWVPVRRRGSSAKQSATYTIIPVFMENEVEASITSDGAKLGFPDVRIAP